MSELLKFRAINCQTVKIESWQQNKNNSFRSTSPRPGYRRSKWYFITIDQATLTPQAGLHLDLLLGPGVRVDRRVRGERRGAEHDVHQPPVDQVAVHQSETVTAVTWQRSANHSSPVVRPERWPGAWQRAGGGGRAWPWRAVADVHCCVDPKYIYLTFTGVFTCRRLSLSACQFCY